MKRFNTTSERRVRRMMFRKLTDTLYANCDLRRDERRYLADASEILSANVKPKAHYHFEIGADK